MFLSLFLLFIRDGENTSAAYSYTFRHAATILIWGLFFGASFIIFDVKAIPVLVSRLVHFLLNGVATCIWIVAIQTQVNSNLLQIIFFALFAYVFLYWSIHFVALGFGKLAKKFEIEK